VNTPSLVLAPEKNERRDGQREEKKEGERKRRLATPASRPKELISAMFIVAHGKRASPALKGAGSSTVEPRKSYKRVKPHDSRGIFRGNWEKFPRRQALHIGKANALRRVGGLYIKGDYNHKCQKPLYRGEGPGLDKKERNLIPFPSRDAGEKRPSLKRNGEKTWEISTLLAPDVNNGQGGSNVVSGCLVLGKPRVKESKKKRRQVEVRYFGSRDKLYLGVRKSPCPHDPSSAKSNSTVGVVLL